MKAEWCPPHLDSIGGFLGSCCSRGSLGSQVSLQLHQGGLRDPGSHFRSRSSSQPKNFGPEFGLEDHRENENQLK